jgi:hypothetical protein
MRRRWRGDFHKAQTWQADEPPAGSPRLPAFGVQPLDHAGLGQF